MKKIILSLVFVLGIVTMGNTNIEKKDSSLVIMNPDECSDLYFSTRDHVLSQGHSLHVAVLAGIAAEEACDEEMEEIIE